MTTLPSILPVRAYILTDNGTVVRFSAHTSDPDLCVAKSLDPEIVDVLLMQALIFIGHTVESAKAKTTEAILERITGSRYAIVVLPRNVAAAMLDYAAAAFLADLPALPDPNGMKFLA